MTYLILVTGRNAAPYIGPCLASIAMQRSTNYRVSITDDCSDDHTPDLITKFVSQRYDKARWTVTHTPSRRYALENQYNAWMTADLSDDDVVVWLDADDRLAHPDVLTTLDSYYANPDTWMTYGSYAPVPASHPSAATCKPARQYPGSVIRTNSFRYSKRCYNHLRTISWRVLKHITAADLTDDSGQFFRANTDASVMIPALELSGTHSTFIPEVLYAYTCDSPDAVWRTAATEIDREGAALRNKERKRRLG